MYEVEVLSNQDKIVINKPGGKRSFGRIAKEDYMVFILENKTGNLWLISHEEIHDDISLKSKIDNVQTNLLIDALKKVCEGFEVEEAIKETRVNSQIGDGLSTEAVLKVYKWIWGQEDCNYPNGEGRWLSMNALLVLKNNENYSLI
jgi:hypothetical protein